jgi:hypothetical protein
MDSVERILAESKPFWYHHNMSTQIAGFVGLSMLVENLELYKSFAAI